MNRGMRGAGFCAAALLGSVMASSGCASDPSGPRLIAVGDPVLRPPFYSEWVNDYRAAMASVAAALERELQIPVRATLHLYPNRQAFEAALIGEGYDPSFARDTASSMDAIGGFRRVLLNEASLTAVPWRYRLALLAHELAHTVQYELSDSRRGASDQWLREGFAEWMSSRVLESLGLSSMPIGRRENILRLRPVYGNRLPRLDEMVTFRQWVALRTRRPDIPIYAQAFLATDFLIARHGMPAVLDYFRAFAASDDRLGHFRHAFGEDLGDFERAFSGHLQRLMQ